MNNQSITSWESGLPSEGPGKPVRDALSHPPLTTSTLNLTDFPRIIILPSQLWQAEKNDEVHPDWHAEAVAAVLGECECKGRLLEKICTDSMVQRSLVLEMV